MATYKDIKPDTAQQWQGASAAASSSRGCSPPPPSFVSPLLVYASPEVIRKTMFENPHKFATVSLSMLRFAHPKQSNHTSKVLCNLLYTASCGGDT